MDGIKPSRLAALSGAAYFVLALVGELAVPGQPEFMAKSSTVQTFYADHQNAILAGFTLFLLSAIALVVFAAVLRTAIRAQGRGGGTLAGVVFGGTVCAAALMFASAAIGMAGAIHVQEKGAIAAWEASAFWDIDQILYGLAAPMALAVAVFGCGLASLRHGLLPKWLGALSIAIGVALAVPPINHVVIVVFAFWALVASLLLATRDARVPSASAPATEAAT